MKLVREEEPSESSTLTLGGALDFMRLLWGLDHSLQSVSKRMVKVLGVTGPQRLVIRVVGRFPGISAGEISDILCLHPSTLTGILQRLQRRGLVSRRRDPEDARRSRFTLSARGKALDAQQNGTVEAAVMRALDRIPNQKLAAGAEVISILADEMAREAEHA
jgi:DNA-binding MarR family transcriptional regulator